MHFFTDKRHFFLFASFLALLLLLSPSVYTAEISPRKKILVLSDKNSASFLTVNFSEGLAMELSNSRPPVTVSSFSLDFNELERNASALNTGELKKRIFGGASYDLIVPLDVASLSFIHKHRTELHPETPVVFVIAANYHDSLLSYNTNMTGIVLEPGVDAILSLAGRLHPGLKNIYVISDTGRISNNTRKYFSELEDKYRNRFLFSYLVNLREDSISALAGKVEKNSAIFLEGNLIDARNSMLIPRVTAATISQELPRIPVYSISYFTVSFGTLASRLANKKSGFRAAAVIIVSILRGNAPSGYGVKVIESGLIFDYNAIRRLGIDESKLPPGARVIGRPESLFERYKQLFILISVSLIGLSVVIIILLFNIRKRKKTEEKLRQSEERLNFALAGSNDGLWDWNIETGEIYFSNRFLEILEYRESELQGDFRAWQKLAHKDDIHGVLESLNNHIKGLSPVFGCEYRMLTKSGIYRWILAKGKVVAFNSQGKAVRMTGTIKDISDRKEYEMALRESEKKFRSIVEQSSDGIIIIDGNGKVIEWNQGFEKISGLSRDEALGHYYWDIQYRFYPEAIKNPSIYEKFRNRIKDAIETGSAPWMNQIIENTIELEDGSIKIIQQTIFPIRSDKGLMLGGISRDITGIKEAEKALRESEKKFRELVDLLPQVVFEIDLNGNILFANNNAFTVFGYNRDEMLHGLNIFEFLDPSEYERVGNNLRKSISGETPGNEYLAIRKDGTRFPMIVHSTPIIRDNKAIGLRGIIVDITERKLIEEAVRESEEKYRTLVENQGEGVAIIDLDKTFLYSNPAAEKIFGVASGGLNGRRLKEFTDEADFMKITLLSQQREAEVKTSFDLDIIRPCGEKRNLFLTVTPYIKKEGRIYGSFLVFLDQTERRKAEDQLRKLSQAVYQSPAMIVITNFEGIIEFVNPKFIQVTGFTAEEAIGKKTSILKSGESNGETYKKLWHTIASGNEWKGEFLNKKKNGELYWEWASISPITDDKGTITHFLAIKEDITDRKKVQQELIVAKETAEKSDRLKSEFLAQMSHEIRTPLNSILSFTSLLKEELADKISDDLKSSFRIIDNGGRRLIRTIDLILNMSQVQTGNYELNPSILDINKDVLENVMLEFVALAREKKLEFTYTARAKNCRILADQYTVSQIFTNLIDNALKYTPKGKVEITLYNNSRNDICVEIKDSGIGISEDYMPHLFSSFSQEETGYTRKFEGNGLGLALVKKYVELNSATIKVDSQKGVGSCFTVVFSNSDAE